MEISLLVWMYTRLAKSEERDTQNEFGMAYEKYKSEVPAFLPRFKRETMVDLPHNQ